MSRAFAVAVAYPKKSVNIGTLLRSAVIFGASAIYIVGARYSGQPGDTLKAERHVPVMHFATWDALWASLPRDWQPVAVERGEGSRELRTLTHPKHAVYVLGPEDGNVPPEVVRKCVATVELPGDYCLNVSVAGSIVMYDRIAKEAG